MAKKRFFQKIKELEVKKDSSHTENSSYWEYVRTRAKSSDIQEYVLSNPDVLPETEIAAPSTPQLIMGEAILHLQGRQKEVYLLTMREGKSLAEAAEVLGMAKGTAQKYKERAIKFIENWCRQAIEKGRV
jgi:DNA-directed RNA polymerase specialized sigma24 family protein